MLSALVSFLNTPLFARRPTWQQQFAAVEQAKRAEREAERAMFDLDIRRRAEEADERRRLREDAEIAAAGRWLFCPDTRQFVRTHDDAIVSEKALAASGLCTNRMLRVSLDRIAQGVR